MAGADDPIARIRPLWDALDRLKSTAGPDESTFARRERPWETRFPDIRAAWESLTAPSNVSGLEAWARQPHVNVIAREAAEQALAACRARAASSSILRPAMPRWFPLLRGPMLLRHRLADWQEGADRVAAAERALVQARTACVQSAFVAGGASLVALMAGGVAAADPAVTPSGAWKASWLAGAGIVAGLLALGLMRAGAALGRGSAGGGRLTRTLRGVMGGTLPTTLAVIASMAWLVREAIAGREPWYVPLAGSLAVAGLATAPLLALWALARYRDVYADADARPALPPA